MTSVNKFVWEERSEVFGKLAFQKKGFKICLVRVWLLSVFRLPWNYRFEEAYSKEGWLGWQGSNLRMAGSKPAALPLGYTPESKPLTLRSLCLSFKEFLVIEVVFISQLTTQCLMLFTGQLLPQSGGGWSFFHQITENFQGLLELSHVLM